MNVQLWQSFVTTAELKSMAKASEMLHLSHPALSKQIRKLEDHYGTELLIRSAAGVELTEAGQLLYERLPRMLAELSDIRQEIMLLAGNAAIRLGALPSVAACRLPSAVYEMEADGLHIDLTVQNTSEELFALLRSRALDAILVDRLDDGAPQLWTQTLFAEPYFVVLPMHHPLAASPGISLEQLEEQPLVMYPPACSIRKRISSLFAEQMMSPCIKTEIPFGAFMLGYVAAGAGVGIVPQMIADSINNPLLSAVPLAHPSAVRTLALVTAQAATGKRLLPFLNNPPTQSG